MSHARRAAALVCAVIVAGMGTSGPAAASRVPASSGQSSPAAPHIAGTIRTETRRQLLDVTVLMIGAGGEAPAPADTRDVRIAPDGTFLFRNVPPGRYEIRARADVEKEGTMLFGAYAVEVTNRDVDNIDLVLRQGATLTGTVVFPSGRAPRRDALSTIRVRAPLADGTSFGDALSGTLRPDGSFRIRGVMAGTHTIVLEGLPAPWTVTSVIVAGRDVIDSVVDVESGQQIGGVRVTLSDAAPEIAGTVSDGRGSPAAGATVVIVPLAEQFWTPTSRRIGIARTDDAGKYRCRGLPPGDYRAAAALEIDEREARTRTIQRRISESGAPLTVDDRRVQALDLTLVPAASLRRATPR